MPAATMTAARIFEEPDSGVVTDKPKKVKKSKKSKSAKDEEMPELVEEIAGDDESERLPKQKKTKKRKLNDEAEASPQKSSKKKKAKVEPKEEPKDEDSSSTDGDAPPEMEFKEEWDMLSPETQKKLKERGVIQLFPVQARTFKTVRDGEDVIVQSRTGSGKTLAFAIPTVERLQEEKLTSRGRSPRALILAPTRELASQICRDVESISTGLTACAIYGGVPYAKQENILFKGCDVVVGTPGRVKDLLEKGSLKMDLMKIVALDEVDRMLDMAPDIIFLCYMPRLGQKYRGEIYEKVPPIINLVESNANRTSKTVRHLAIQTHYTEWSDVIGDLVTAFCGRSGRAMIFASTKRDTSDLALSDNISDAQMIHGDIEQATREQTLQAFRDGKMRVLVCTDVAARGLDIPEVDLVIQTEPPSDIDSYIHRSGRTGRAGRSGVCICLYKPKQLYQLKQVEKEAGFKFELRGPVSAVELEEAAAKDVKRQIAKLPEKSSARFLEIAREMIAEAEEEEESSTEKLLAAAIAIMSGVTDSTSRSIITGKKGFQTWQMNVSFEMNNQYLIFKLLEKGIGEQARIDARNVRVFKDRMGAAFDLPTKMTNEVSEKWNDSDKFQLKRVEKASDLPELEAKKEIMSEGYDYDNDYSDSEIKHKKKKKK
ncbi:Oidioi.mRNA.OKI2018_I69.XSR.g15809.t1.cds [Oikopleura dioica]|uniref:Oidioi.mRNA.OKI2018_I69.XSR.g15809.t1.cds n=1 Tax=Oikopleura dioica TaxID=34765 RepID=A0ABN7SJ24_OIKDI|nr:Oidioi.mRNA.OKI2018_I69.XSR.g15809.t1.cds [Oikopleura dioica]